MHDRLSESRLGHDRTPRAELAPRPTERIVLHPRADVAVIVMLGEHDLCTAEELRRVLSKLLAENKLLVVDLSHASFIDSSCIQNLLNVQKQALATNRQLIIQTGNNQRVLRVLEISGVRPVLRCVDSRAEALNGHAAKSEIALPSTPLVPPVGANGR